MNNGYLEYYGKEKISPVNIDKDKWEQHVKARKKLYRQLGIPLQCFAGKNILEFGPGSGWNTLALLKDISKGRVQHVDLVEPNETGRLATIKLLEDNGIETSQYMMHTDVLEKFYTNKKYDFIIAEQFIQHLPNWKECLSSLKKFAKENTIIIITCSDEIGFYIEKMKRFIGRYFTKDIDNYREKVNILVKVFTPQLENLKGMTRLKEDWVKDQMLNDIVMVRTMNISDAIKEFDNGWNILGVSQNLFTDYSWYKDINYDYVENCKLQYEMKKHMLLVAGEHKETIRTVEENKRLEEAVSKANDLVAEFEKDQKFDIDDLINAVCIVTDSTDNLTVKEFNREFLEIVNNINKKSDIDLSKYKVFNRTFGKSSQYICFEKI